MGVLSDLASGVRGFVGDLTGSNAADAASAGGRSLSQAAISAANLRERAIKGGLTAQQALVREGLSSQLGLTREGIAAQQGLTREGLADQQGFTREGLASQEALGREGLGILRGQLSPFAAGFGAEDIQGLRGLATDPNQQLSFLQDNPLFNALKSQARESTFRTQGVGGGLGGSGTDEILQNQFLSLGNSLIDQQINRQLPLLQSARGAASTIGTGGANILSGIGQSQFQGLSGIGSARLGALSNLGGSQLGALSILGGDHASALSGLGASQLFGQTGIGEARAGGVEQSAEALATGRIGAANASAQGASNILGAATSIAGLFSDERLKTNIEKIGSKNGINVYTWSWNDKAESIGLKGNGVGHIAQQVKEIHPELVTQAENGFLMIDYSTDKTVSLN